MKGTASMHTEKKFQNTESAFELSEDRYPHFKNHIECFSVEGDTARLDIEIDSSHHVYLKDHIFGTDSFVPATMIMELFFEAAVFYSEYQLNLDVANLRPAQLVDFSILRALAMLPGNSMKAQFIYRKVIKNKNEIEFEIEIVSKRINKMNQVLGTRLNATSRVVLSYNDVEIQEFLIPQEEYNYYQLPKDSYYKFYFPSLGPLFQSSCARFAVNSEKTLFIGEYDCSGKEKNFISNQESTFLTSPLGNDSCLQYAVFFSRYINLIGRLPIGGKQLDFCRPHPLTGKVKVFVELVAIDEDMVCNICSFDSNGIIFKAKEFVVRKSPYHSLMERKEFDDMINKCKAMPFIW